MNTQTDPLQFALDIEARGAQLYLSLAAHTDNKLAKLLFYSLAGKEVEHARLFDTIYAKIRVKETHEPLPLNPPESIEAELKSFFEKAGKADLKRGTVQKEGYESAMLIERKSYDAYKSFHDVAVSEDEKKFFERLMCEENEHYAALANIYLYLTNIGDWLQEDEGTTWNWMNT